MSRLLVKTYPQPDSLLNSGKQGEAPETAGGTLLGTEPAYTLEVQSMSWRTYQPPPSCPGAHGFSHFVCSNQPQRGRLTTYADIIFLRGHHARLLLEAMAGNP